MIKIEACILKVEEKQEERGRGKNNFKRKNHVDVSQPNT